MRKLIVAFTAFAAACGIPGDTPLNDITADQWDLICDRAVDTDAEARTVECGDPIGTLTIPATTVADCTTAGASFGAEGCEAIFDDWVACQEEPDLTDGQICGTEEITVSAECLRVAACIGDSDPDTDTDSDSDSDSDTTAM